MDRTFWRGKKPEDRASDPRHWSTGLPGPRRIAVLDRESGPGWWDKDLGCRIEIAPDYPGGMVPDPSLWWAGEFWGPAALLSTRPVAKDRRADTRETSSPPHPPPGAIEVRNATRGSVLWIVLPSTAKVKDLFETATKTWRLDAASHVMRKGAGMAKRAWTMQEAERASPGVYELIPSPHGAVARTWDGGGVDENWNTAANWTADITPVAGDDTTFDATSVKNCTVNVALPALASTTIAAGYTGTINNTVSQAYDAWGATTIAGGTLTSSANQRAIAPTTLTMTAGTMNVINTSDVGVTSTISISGGTWTSGNLESAGTAASNVSFTITIPNFDCRPNGSVTKTLTSNITVSNRLRVSAQTSAQTGTLAVGANTVTSNNTASIGIATVGAGIVTFSTGTWTQDSGNITIGASGTNGTFGSNSAHTFDAKTSLTVTATTGTLLSPSAAGVIRTSGATLTISGTYTDNGAVFTFNAVGTTTLGAAWTSAAAVTINSGTTFNTSAASNFAFTHSGALTVSGTLTPNASTVTSNGAVTISSAATMGANTAWAFDANAAVTVTGTLSAPNTSTGWTLAGNLSGAGTLTNNSGTCNVDGTSAINFTQAFFNLTMTTGSSATWNSVITVSNATTISAGTTTVAVSQGGVNSHGAMTISGGTLSATASAGTSASALVGTSLSMTGGTVNITQSPTSWELLVWGNTTVTGGTWTAGILSPRRAALSLNITITITQISLISAGGIDRTMTLNSALTWSASMSVHGFDGNTTTLVCGANALTASGTATLSLGGTISGGGNGIMTFTTGSITAGGAVTVGTPTTSGTLGSNTAWTFDCNANLTIDTNGTLSAPNGDTATAFTFSGSTFTNNGTYTSNSGRLTFDLAGAQTFAAGSGTYGGLSTAAATTVTQSQNATLTVASNLPNTAGATYQTSATITLTANAAITVVAGTLGQNAAWLFDMNASFTITSTFSAPSGDTATAFTFSGATFQNNGTYTANGGRLTFDLATAQTFNAGSGTYANIGMSNDAATITHGGNATLTGTMTVQASRTWSVSASITLTCNSGSTLTVNGTLTSNGTVTINGTYSQAANLTVPSGGTVDASGATSITLTSTINLTVTGTLKLKVTQLRYSGTFTNNGTATGDISPEAASTGGNWVMRVGTVGESNPFEKIIRLATIGSPPNFTKSVADAGQPTANFAKRVRGSAPQNFEAQVDAANVGSVVTDITVNSSGTLAVT